MKIIDAVRNEKGSPFKIPDANRNDLPEFFKDMGFKVGVEIGVDKAIYAQELCKSGCKMYGVDPWLYYSDYPHPKGQARLDFLYEHCQRTLAPHDYTIIRKTSMEAVKDFEDNSIDFVYIDGHHGFKYVAEDIWEWSKKVRPGGVISGHDYARTRHVEIRDPFVLHVAPVVDGYIRALGIKNWYLIGSEESIPGEKRDTFRSWFWINP
jgi:SAM-dependent methyltransferase